MKIGAILVLLTPSLWALPASQMQVAPKRGVVIATVDLEKVFQVYPATKKARQDLEGIIVVKETEIASKRVEVFKLIEDIQKIKAQVQIDTTTPTAPVDAAALTQKEEELKNKKEELKTLQKNVEKNLEDLEQAKAKTLLGRVYEALKELAQEKNVDIIVDKNAILWGSSKLDLTRDLIEKLKSKYIESE